MRRLWYVLFCVLLSQRVEGQTICKPDLYISMDDLLRALNSGQLNLPGNPIGQDVCGSRQDVIPDSYGSQQNSMNTELSPICNQPVSYSNQISFQPSFELDQGGCGYQQPSVSFTTLPYGSQSCGYSSLSQNQLSGNSQQSSLSFSNEPSFSIGGQNSPSQPSFSLNQPCGNSQQSSLSFSNQPSFSIGSLNSQSQPSLSLNQPCGNSQQPSITFSGQPSFSFGGQSYDSQSSCSLNQPCGNIQQPSISFSNQPSFSISDQSYENQPRISLNQPFRGNIQPSFTFPSQPSLSIGSQSSRCQPSLSLNQQDECNSAPLNSFSSQPSLSFGSSYLYQQLGRAQPSFLQNQEPSISYSQPISLPSLSCGNKQSFSTNRLSSSLCESNSQQPSVTSSINNLSSCQRSQAQVPSNQCNSQKQPQCGNVVTANDANVGNVVSIVPNALLQAPPFGIFFDGDNLIIDGGVQICGTMPFSSAVRVSGVLPASGVGNVQYVCEDIC